MEASDDARERRQRTEDSEIEALRLEYTELQQENVRLREARGALTRQLGPLPISAAVVAGLVSGFGAGGSAHLNLALAIGALVVFAVMVLVSVGYSNLLPYRKLRDAHERESGERPPVSWSGARKAEAAWYQEMIELERAVREGQAEGDREKAGGTAEQVDRERAVDIDDEARSEAQSWTSRLVRTLASAKQWVWELVWPRSPDTLKACYDVEWRGVSITKGLFMLVIVQLILARIV